VSNELLLERILRIINEGKRVATYKLALLLALIDAAVINPEAGRVSTRQLAESVLDLYFPQVRPYTTLTGDQVDLRTNTSKGSSLARAVVELRSAGNAIGLNSLYQIHKRLPAGYESALSTIEHTLVRNPIPRLQNIGDSSIPFLYSITWKNDQSLAPLRNRGEDFITWLPDVARRLVVLGPVLRPLIEVHWMADVAKWSKIELEGENLQHHLFGTDRTRFSNALRDGLAELQSSKCFYCDDLLSSRRDIDHFIPWSRWPNDAIENLVVADNCNSLKGDSIATVEHFNRWLDRLTGRSEELVQLAEATGMLSAPQRSFALARSTYDSIDPESPLWKKEQEFEVRGRVKIRALL